MYIFICLIIYSQRRFFTHKLIQPDLLHLFCHRLYFFCLFCRNQHARLTVHGNDIIFASSGNLCQAQVCLFPQSIQKPAHHLIGISSLLMDLISGMSAQESVNPDLYQGSFGCFLLHRDHCLIEDTSGTSCGQDAFFFGIDVDQHLSFQL